MTGFAADDKIPAISSMKYDGITCRRRPSGRVADAAANTVVAGSTAHLCDPAVQGRAVALAAQIRLPDRRNRCGSADQAGQIPGNIQHLRCGQNCLAAHERLRVDGCADGPRNVRRKRKNGQDVRADLSRGRAVVAGGAVPHEEPSSVPRSLIRRDRGDKGSVKIIRPHGKVAGPLDGVALLRHKDLPGIGPAAAGDREKDADDDYRTFFHR